MPNTDSYTTDKLSPEEAAAAADALFNLYERPNDLDGGVETAKLIGRAYAKLRSQGEKVVDDDDRSPTEAQGIEIARLMRRHNATSATVTTNPFDLPEGYVYVVLTSGSGADFHAGVDRDGRASS